MSGDAEAEPATIRSVQTDRELQERDWWVMRVMGLDRQRKWALVLAGENATKAMMGLNVFLKMMA